MRTSAARWTAGSVAVASVALMAAGLALAFADRHHVPATLTKWDFSDIAGDVEDLDYCFAHRVAAAAHTASVARRQPGASARLHGPTPPALNAAPPRPGARAALWVTNSLSLVPIFTVVFLFLLFPSGRLRSRRWLPVAGVEAAIFVLVLIASIVAATRYYLRPFALYGERAGPGAAAARAAARARRDPAQRELADRALREVHRRGAPPAEVVRRRGGGVRASPIIRAVLTNSAAVHRRSRTWRWSAWTATSRSPCCKYRLYDIDIVISRARAVRDAGRVHHAGLRRPGGRGRRGGGNSRSP